MASAATTTRSTAASQTAGTAHVRVVRIYLPTTITIGRCQVRPPFPTVNAVPFTWCPGVKLAPGTATPAQLALRASYQGNQKLYKKSKWVAETLGDAGAQAALPLKKRLATREIQTRQGPFSAILVQTSHEAARVTNMSLVELQHEHSGDVFVATENTTTTRLDNYAFAHMTKRRPVKATHAVLHGVWLDGEGRMDVVSCQALARIVGGAYPKWVAAHGKPYGIHGTEFAVASL
jgi:hypothetical protein